MLISRASAAFLLIATLAVAVFCPDREAGAVETARADLVRGTLARSEAVFSGRFQYVLTSGTEGSKRTVHYDFIFSGPSWKRRARESASEIPLSFSKAAIKAGIESKATLQGDQVRVILSHRGKGVEYNATPQHDKSIRHTARVVSGEDPLDKMFPVPPHFVGSFWFASTKAYVEKNLNRAISKPSVDIGGIKTSVLEWEVSEADRYKAFNSSNDITAKGGVLRIYLAPQLGYLIPRIEHIGAGGAIGAVMDASDFFQVNGIFVPRKAKLQYLNATGKGFFEQYQITDVKDINEPIEDSAFTIQLPVGTEVADSRSGKESFFFEVKEGGGLPEDLFEILGAIPQPPPSRGWWRAVLLGLGIGVVAVLIFLGWRRLRSRRATS